MPNSNTNGLPHSATMPDLVMSCDAPGHSPREERPLASAKGATRITKGATRNSLGRVATRERGEWPPVNGRLAPCEGRVVPP